MLYSNFFALHFWRFQIITRMNKGVANSDPGLGVKLRKPEQAMEGIRIIEAAMESSKQGTTISLQQT